MPPKTSQTAPRRSLRLREVRESREPHDLHRLPSEVRLQIFSYVVITERPFMIGRVQEERRRKTNGSPRDMYTNQKYLPVRVKRNNRRNRPKQPAVTRVCRLFREEALPLWYASNQFWLIHNEHQYIQANGPYPFRAPRPGENIKDLETARRRRGFEEWLSQTPPAAFNFMRHVSLCGYSIWPSRLMVSLNLAEKTLIGIRHYSTFGDELGPWTPEFVEGIERVMVSHADSDAFSLLKAVLLQADDMFSLRQFPPSMPLYLLRRQPMSGWDYDF